MAAYEPANGWPDYCTFQGVPCSQGSPGKFTALDLRSFNMTGTLPASFPALASFLASNVSSDGSSAGGLGGQPGGGSVQYFNSTRIYLGSNPSLQVDLSLFEGLNNLTTLVLDGTPLLGGTLPAALASLTNLESLSLVGSSLVGTLPDVFAGMTGLTSFSAGTNPQLSGSLPPSLLALASLRTLSVPNANLMGSLPSLCPGAPNLVTADLSGNSLSGSLPAVWNCLSLTYLDLKSNRLSGSIPPGLADAFNCTGGGNNPLSTPAAGANGGTASGSSIIQLGLSGNVIQGDIPASLLNLTCLQQLSVSQPISVCSAGQYEAGGAVTSTITIGAKTVANTAGWQKANCGPCPANTFSSSPGATACSPCAAGYFNNPDFTACLPCDAGQAQNVTSGLCAPCPGGTFSASGSVTCALCSTNTYSSADRTTCVSCPSSSTSPAGSPSLDSCACAVGQVRQLVGGSVVCTPCTPGTAYDAASHSCLPCTPPFYSSGSGAVSCTPVDVGYVSVCSNNGSTCTGQAACPVGSHYDAASLSCRPCASGSYSSVTASVSCKPVDVGFVSVCSGNGTNCTAQAACPAGTSYSPASLSCQPCLSGTYSAVAASASCTLVDVGFVSVCVAGSCNSQAPCPVGSFLNASLLACSPCPAGSYTASTGAVACATCPAGTIAALPNSSSCDACPLNSRDTLGHTACVCTPTFFDSRFGANSSQPMCSACTEGGTCDTDGVLLASEGYWRENPDDTIFLKCRGGFCLAEEPPSALPPSRRLLDNSSVSAFGNCAEGHQGVLCAQCRDGYTMQGGACKVCAASDAWVSWSTRSKTLLIVLSAPVGIFFICVVFLMPLLPAWERAAAAVTEALGACVTHATALSTSLRRALVRCVGAEPADAEKLITGHSRQLIGSALSGRLQLSSRLEPGSPRAGGVGQLTSRLGGAAGRGSTRLGGAVGHGSSRLGGALQRAGSNLPGMVSGLAAAAEQEFEQELEGGDVQELVEAAQSFIYAILRPAKILINCARRAAAAAGPVGVRSHPFLPQSFRSSPTSSSPWTSPGRTPS